MTGILVDTGAWVAIVNRRDRHHQEASDTLQSLLREGWSLLTTNHVIGETYTVLRTGIAFEPAWQFLQLVARTPRLTRQHVSQDEETAAYALLEKYRDHAFSFVDGVSFVVMRAKELEFAFAFDGHFSTAGFARVPVDVRPADLPRRS